VCVRCNNSSSSGNPTADKIAAAAGLTDFKKIKELEFTFNVQKDSSVSRSRHWKWYPKTSEVVFLNEGDSVSFKRYDTSTARLKELNAQFTNDEYWLLFPCHLVWDKGMTLTDNGNAVGPVTGDSLHKITVQYNKTDGFTPGDMYVIYSGEDNKINEWEYHKSGITEPSLMTTWEDYKSFNGLQLSTNHQSKDGSFRLYFTNVRVME
jgi:hypothetical protein